MNPQVEEICLRALDLEPEQREAWLATACAGDEALRREVSSLLAQEERAEQLRFLEQPASKLMADWLRDSQERTLAEGPAEAAASSAAFVPGERILHYLILEPLGAGGSGRVFLARDEKLLRPVAIKCLIDELAQDKQWLARFRREARALASLNHPNIATIHALEQSGDTLFLVMEYVEGQTLLDRFRAGRLPVSETLALFRQIAAALEAAHTAGIIHRDLKPANIKVTPRGIVRLLDFGLAREIGHSASAAHSDEDPLTATGFVLGTAPYMSPEQIEGRPLDERTDLWAFGCLFYEALTGRHPFLRSNNWLTWKAIMESEPDWSALPAETPPRIAELIGRCLRKRTEERLGQAAEAEKIIGEVINADGSHSRSDRRLFRRAAVLALAAALILLTLNLPPVKGSLRRLYDKATATQGAKTAAKFRLAILPFRVISQEGSEIGQGLTRLLSDYLAQSARIEVYTAADRADYVLSGTIWQTRGLVIVSFSLKGDGQPFTSEVIGSTAQIIQQIARQVYRLLRVPEESDRQISQAEIVDDPKFLRAVGLLRTTLAESSFSEAVTLLTRLRAEKGDSALLELTLSRACLLLYGQTLAPELSRQATEALQAARQLAQSLPPEAPLWLEISGRLNALEGRYDQAIVDFRRVLEQQPDNPEVLYELAETYRRFRRPELAAQIYQQLVRQDEKNWLAENELGALAYERGQYRAAREHWLRALRARPDEVVIQINLAHATRDLGQDDEALALYNRAIAASHSEEAYNGRGVLNFYRRNYEQAAADFQRARDLRPSDALFHANLADARYWIPALRGLARADYGRAISLRREELRTQPEPSLRAQLAVWLARRGEAADLKEARDAIELALVQAPADPTCLVSSVCVWQLTGDHERAVSQAIEAVRKGCNPDELRRDPWLEAVTADPKFQQAVQTKR